MQIGDKLIYARNNQEYLVKKISVSKDGTHYHLALKEPEVGKEEKEFKVSESTVEKYFFYTPPLHPETIAEQRRERKKQEKRQHGHNRGNFGPGIIHYLDDHWD